jgi:MerR family redox-sensitive transcriptional activator SoxR
MNPSRELSVGEVARRSGVAVSTLHFYEARGLIHGWRTPGNQRRYSRDVLRRIAVIRVAQRAGIALNIIEEALAVVPRDQPVTAAEWRRLTSTWRAMLNERIRALTQLRDHLEDCIGCGCLSLERCPLRNPDDVAARRGNGPVLLQESSEN